MADENLVRELEYFKAHQKELVSKYQGKFLVIKDQTVHGAFDSEAEAYASAIKDFQLGTFLIQECLPGEQSYSQTFHSRVAF